MTAPIFRPATPLDAGRIGAILSGWIDETAWMPRIHTRAEDVAHAGMMVDRGWVTVAEQNGIVAGFLARDAEDIHALYIDAAQRGQQLGKELLNAAKAQCDALSLWTFQQNSGAQNFYTRHGFEEVARTDGATNDEGLPDIRYHWQRTSQ